MDHPVSGKLACCCFQIISTCSIWRPFTCVNCGHLRMRISCGTGMHTRSELGSSPVTCGFRSSFFKDGASSLHTRSSKLSHIWHEKKKLPHSDRFLCVRTAGMFISTVNRVRLRAFACLPGASAVRATTLSRACIFPRGWHVKWRARTRAHPTLALVSVSKRWDAGSPGLVIEIF